MAGYRGDNAGLAPGVSTELDSVWERAAMIFHHRDFRKFATFLLGLGAWAAAGTIAHAQINTWTLRPGSQVTLTVSINQRLIIPNITTEFVEAPQLPGSLTSAATGTLKTTGNFLESVNFGPF